MIAFGGQPKPQEIPCRQYCAICGNLYAVDYYVSHQAIWDEAIHPHYRDSTVCLECFIKRADEKMLPWDHWIKFYPCSARSMEIARMTAANESGKMPLSEPQSAVRSEGRKPKEVMIHQSSSGVRWIISFMTGYPSCINCHRFIEWPKGAPLPDWPEGY